MGFSIHGHVKKLGLTFHYVQIQINPRIGTTYIKIIYISG